VVGGEKGHQAAKNMYPKGYTNGKIKLRKTGYPWFTCKKNV